MPRHYLTEDKVVNSLPLLSLLSIPLFQTIIWKMGMTVDRNLFAQFNHPGIDDGTAFTIVFGGIAQCFIGLVLGGLMLLAQLCRPYIRRILYFGEGMAGVLFFAWILERNWSFQSNHCTENGCDLTSPYVFDFVTCVFFGLPLLWCLGIIFFSSGYSHTDQTAPIKLKP